MNAEPFPYLPDDGPSSWLRACDAASLGRVHITAALDRELTARAIAAQHDPVAGDALFIALAGWVRYYTARYRRWNLEPYDRDDLLQETYIVWRRLLERWPGPAGITEAGPWGFGFYFVRVYPLRLADRVARMISPAGTSRDDDKPSEPDAAAGLEALPHPSADESIAPANPLLDAICARLKPRDALVFRSLMETGRAAPEVARYTGVNVRTVYRIRLRGLEVGRRILAVAA